MVSTSLFPPTGPEGPASRFRLAPDPRSEAAHRRRLLRDIDGAVQSNAFILHYQPRIALDSGERTGAEALIRWQHPRRGMVPPAQFIPIAEKNGRIGAIGGWVLQAACREAASWPEPSIVSVNVSARQLEDGLLLGQVATALELSGLDPERLELELTEGLLVDVAVDMLLMLSAIRDLGVGIALDDFGTGFASLGMLKRLPLTTMKLDRSLVRNLPADHEDAAIARAVIAAGHAMGLQVVAEGIETEAQRAFLSACGCDEGQGYLFGHPLPAGALRPGGAA
ncbi:diguanylate cyclase/phosphodiesterase (GGDEF & EAL domains) with PAS/PAC sensor(s) [Rhodovastum atsumiense]|uniref:EAL domain-containing protein n=1 Tax=Rhodovastum atsumiense TaxID=504468 RepID=A0A5M6IM28_9PROT|nr:EAL domain-containing protein [Rhodovastum atsumiense]KAA5608997.1 EAL domain-containing protein [Rhodovastum atsumiense]CAH2599088.1 diguanylate cyclase/phosphodiesterase (GGDEF & EAL domains) with PAS/PAC sensor(s) [Rhodovastum atsumiense]